MVLRKIIAGGNKQLSVTLPKSWAIKNNLKKNDYVNVECLDEPSIEILEKIKDSNDNVIITTNNFKTRKGKVLAFIENGVLLDSGFWVKFSEIKKITKSVK